MKNILAGVIGILIIGAGIYWYLQQSNDVVSSKTNEATTTQNTTVQVPAPVIDKTKTVIGKSVKGNDIVAYHFGEGSREVVFVGGMHGGYSWNTSLLAYEAMDYFEKNPTAIPAGTKVTIVPVMNPDGLSLVVGTTSRFTKAQVTPSQSTQTTARFNGNAVDLNRNFDCDWKASGTWQSKQVSGGSAAFSELESQALKSYMELNKPSSVVVWYSAVGGVFPSKCDGEPSSTTLALTDAYAKASGYKKYADFDFYEVTGDMPNWLSKIGIPAISVLLTNREDTEWTKNLKGIEAVLKQTQ